MTKNATSTKTATKTATVLTVAEYAKAHKLSPKIVRRRLRAVAAKPAAGWRISPALAKKIAA
jgi:hypothetical protein